jgi:hypothetical protein
LEKELMLFSAYKTYPYTADYFSYTQVTLADGTVTGNTYIGVPTQIQLSVSTSFTGNLIMICKTKLQNAGRISNLVDKNGVEIYPDAVWQINSTQPVLNAVGLVEGYKYKATIISGNI